MYKEDLTLNNLQWLICHKNSFQATNDHVQESSRAGKNFDDPVLYPDEWLFRKSMYRKFWSSLGIHFISPL